MASKVVLLSELKEENESFGKVVNDLINLVNRGFETSDAFVLTYEAFLDFINKNNLTKKIAHLIGSGAQNNINKYIENAQLPSDLVKEILREYKKFGTALEDTEVILNGDKIKGENSLLEKIRRTLISNFKDNKNQAIIVQKLHFGKHGRIRTSSKFINTVHNLSPQEINLIQSFVDKFKSLFYIPHEIEFTIEKDRILVNKIRPETHIALNRIDSLESDFKIIKNSTI